MKTCPFCHNQIEDDCEYCSNCGSYQPVSNTTSSPIEKEKALQGPLLGVLFALFLGIIGLILVMILGDRKCRMAAIITTVILVILGIIAGIFCALVIINAAFSH